MLLDTQKDRAHHGVAGAPARKLQQQNHCYFGGYSHQGFATAALGVGVRARLARQAVL